MKLRQFFCILILLFFVGLQAQGQDADTTANDPKPNRVEVVEPLQVVKNFIYDLANPDIAPDVVLSQHVLTTKSDDELLDYLIASLLEIRLNLMNKNIDDIQFLNFRDLPRRETSDIDPEGKNVENMFFLHYRKRQVVALYLDQGKIASFTLVSKGRNKAHFVTY